MKKKQKRASGFLTGILLLVVLLGVGIQLYRMQEQLKTARAEEEALAQEIAQVEKENAQLQEDLDNADNPELIEEIAREDLGMWSRGRWCSTSSADNRTEHSGRRA